MKTLVVEDDRAMAAMLRRGLSEEGFAVDVAGDADSADDAVQVYEYDVILLDVMLPGADGFTLCRRWRQQGVATPILFLTVRDDLADRVRGLDLGGDDYLTKPFAFDELLARIRALVRRGQRPPAGPEIAAGPIRIDTVRRHVFLRGERLALTPREYQLLEYLARNADRPVSRTALWEHVWDSYSVPDSNVIDVYIRYLRNKLGRDAALIETRRGAGYVLRTGVPTGEAQDTGGAR